MVNSNNINTHFLIRQLVILNPLNSFMHPCLGAMAKDFLIREASKKWGVTTDEIDVQNGIMKRGKKKKQFVTDAVNQNLSGIRIFQKDNEAFYGMDVKIPGYQGLAKVSVSKKRMDLLNIFPDKNHRLCKNHTF